MAVEHVIAKGGQLSLISSVSEVLVETVPYAPLRFTDITFRGRTGIAGDLIHDVLGRAAAT